VAEADIYIDCDRARVVTSDTDNTNKDLPRFVQGDTLNLRIYFLKSYNRASSYELFPTDGLTVQVALGDLAGEDLYAAQYSWTATDGDHFEGILEMNTAELDTALGSESVLSGVTFEVKYIRDGVPTTVLQETVKVYKALILEDSVVPVATPTPLSAEAADSTYVKIFHSGAIYLSDPDNPTAPMIKIWNDNGVFKADPEA
jgi:hypothetical protein